VKVLNGPKYKQGWKLMLKKLWSLHEMERTGGEPDVVGHDKKTGRIHFFMIVQRKSPKEAAESVCYRP